MVYGLLVEVIRFAISVLESWLDRVLVVVHWLDIMLVIEAMVELGMRLVVNLCERVVFLGRAALLDRRSVVPPDWVVLRRVECDELAEGLVMNDLVVHFGSVDILMVDNLVLTSMNRHFFVDDLVVSDLRLVVSGFDHLEVSVVRGVRMAIRVLKGAMNCMFVVVNRLDILLIIKVMAECTVHIVLSLLMIVVILILVLVVIVPVIRMNGLLPVSSGLIMQLMISLGLERRRLLASHPEVRVLTLDVTHFVLEWRLVLHILRRVVAKDDVVPVIVVDGRHGNHVLLVVIKVSVMAVVVVLRFVMRRCH